MAIRVVPFISLLVLAYLCPHFVGAQQADTVRSKPAVANVLGIQNTLPQTVNRLGQPLLSKIKLLEGGKPVQVNDIDLSAGYYYNRDTSAMTAGVFRDMQGVFNYSLDAGVSLTQIPFAISLDGNNGFYTADHTPFNTFYKANFNTRQYQELLQKQVLAKISPDIVLSSLMSRINAIRKGYEQSLMDEIGAIGKEFTELFKERLDLPAGITDLTKTDISSLQSKLFSKTAIEKINQSRIRYQQIVSSKGQAAADTLTEARTVLAGIKKFEALEKIYAKVIGWKEKFENNKTVKELKSHLPFTPDKYKAYLKNPGNLADIVKKYADLSALQGLFLNMTKLDLGQNPVQNGQLSLQNTMNNGINTAFQGKRAGAGLIIGTNKNVNNWMQAGLNSFVTNEYSGLTGFTLGSGSASPLDQSLSINFFNFMTTPGSVNNGELLHPNYLATAQRQDAVITFHSGYKINDKQQVRIDLSKSFGSYKNNMKEDSSLYKSNPLRSVFGSEGKSNFAASIEYDGELLNTGVRLAVKKVGLGYNNPGNIFLRRGESQVQLGLNRSFLKRKLTLIYKGDYRNQHFDPAKNYTYTTLSNKLQLRYRLKKNNRIGLSWQQSNYKSQLFGLADTRGTSYVLQGDGSYKVNLFHKPVMNTVTLSKQQMNLPLLPGSEYKSRSFFFVHSSALPIQKNLLVFSVMANQSTNKDYYFNTSFINAELSYNYTLSGKLTLTSGTGYYSNTGWNRQIGIRQQLSINAVKKMNIDIGVDYKKAVRVIRAELANQLFVNATVRYSFN